MTYSAKWTKLHTVKFVDGDETIKTATVKDGEKLTDADVPADLTASGKVFEGWFDGTTAFDKDATITADKTFAAKWVGLFNVTFKNGEETIKVAQVKDGAVIAAADIPEDPTDDNYAFIFSAHTAIIAWIFCKINHFSFPYDSLNLRQANKHCAMPSIYPSALSQTNAPLLHERYAFCKLPHRKEKAPVFRGFLLTKK